MTYSIVYSSKTGNTKMLADALHQALPADDCLYFGAPDAQALAAERIYIGFWTDKGSCDAETAAFLAQLTQQEIFLFGTCGFGGGVAYFEQILARVRDLLPESVQLVGSYLCPGKMPQSVRDRYVRIAEEEPAKRSHMQKMIFNFDCALSHPDANDLQALIEEMENCQKK